MATYAYYDLFLALPGHTSISRASILYPPYPIHHTPHLNFPPSNTHHCQLLEGQHLPYPKYIFHIPFIKLCHPLDNSMGQMKNENGKGSLHVPSLVLWYIKSKQDWNLYCRTYSLMYVNTCILYFCIGAILSNCLCT